MGNIVSRVVDPVQEAETFLEHIIVLSDYERPDRSKRCFKQQRRSESYFPKDQVIELYEHGGLRVRTAQKWKSERLWQNCLFLKILLQRCKGFDCRMCFCVILCLVLNTTRLTIMVRVLRRQSVQKTT